MKRAIIIMAKVPSAGNVKTRLQPYFSSDDCAKLSMAFLQDAVNKAKTVCENVILAYSPTEEINALRRILPSQSIYIEQTGRDLGERMFNIFEFAVEQKSDSIVMIGTDSPTFPAEFIEKAFVLLENSADAVLGETEDGGFYLIGLRKLQKEIFENVEWSSPRTFLQTKGNIEKLNFNFIGIPKWFDVDTPEDLQKLKNELSANPQSAPITSEFLKRNLK